MLKAWMIPSHQSDVQEELEEDGEWAEGEEEEGEPGKQKAKLSVKTKKKKKTDVKASEPVPLQLICSRDSSHSDVSESVKNVHLTLNASVYIRGAAGIKETD